MQRRILIGKRQAFLIYIEGIVEIDLINKEILSRLQRLQEFPAQTDNPLEYIGKKVLSSGRRVMHNTLVADLLVEILLGRTVIIVDGIKEGLILETRGGARRSIEEPPTERRLPDQSPAFPPAKKL